MSDKSHAQLLGSIDERSRMTHTLVQDVHRTLHGNGMPGLKTEVDRLKQSHKRTRWWANTVIVSAITSVLGAAVAIVASATNII